MINGWHYAEGAVGPLNLKEMQAVLSKIPDPHNRQVWKAGFKGWNAREMCRSLRSSSTNRRRCPTNHHRSPK